MGLSIFETNFHTLGPRRTPRAMALSETGVEGHFRYYKRFHCLYQIRSQWQGSYVISRIQRKDCYNYDAVGDSLSSCHIASCAVKAKWFDSRSDLWVTCSYQVGYSFAWDKSRLIHARPMGRQAHRSSAYPLTFSLTLNFLVAFTFSLSSFSFLNVTNLLLETYFQCISVTKSSRNIISSLVTQFDITNVVSWHRYYVIMLMMSNKFSVAKPVPGPGLDSGGHLSYAWEVWCAATDEVECDASNVLWTWV